MDNHNVYDRAPQQARPRWRQLSLALAAVVLGAGFAVWQMRPHNTTPTSPQAGMAPGGADAGPMAVVLATAEAGDMPLVLNGLGTVTPLTTVTVRSLLSGYLTGVAFREGQMVRKGDVLAQLDPRLYEASLLQYQGQLQHDQAQLRNAQLDLARYQTLTKQDSIARQTLDTAQATVRQYEGTIKSDQGLVDTQSTNLGYTRISAPVDGRVGLRQVDPGNYVTPSDTNGIVVLTQLQPISIVFTLPEDDLREVLPQLRAGRQMAVTALDRRNTMELSKGTLDTVDNQVDTTTGTFKLRATFSNLDEELFPNQFVNARLLVRTVRNAVLLPGAAIQHGSDGSFVYRLEPGNTVSVQPVRTGLSDSTRTVVLSGVKVGDRVVVDGADRLKDGAAVTVPAPSPAPGKAP